MTSNRPKLTDDARAFIVCQLAAFETPADVAEAVRKEYGVEITRQTVEGYDPNKAAGEKLAPKWKAMFEKARKAYLERTDDVPTINKAVRLRYLDEEVRKARKKGNAVLMASLLEQIAKEAGGTFEGKRQVAVEAKVDVDGKVEHKHIFTAEDNAALLREVLGCLAEDGSGTAE